MSRVMVSVPSGEGRIKSLAAESLCNMEWGDDDVDFKFVNGYGIELARNKIAELSIKEGYDYVLMVDSDVIVPYNALVNLRSDDVNVAFGWAVRGESNEKLTSAVKLGTQGYKKSYYANEIAKCENTLLEVKGCGFYCTLIRTDVFNRITKPWFKYHRNPDGSYLSEDYWFCQKCSEQKIKLYVDTRVGCGHIHERILEAT